MPTVNGKLIAVPQPELDSLMQNVENLAQQFEYLESQMTTMSKKDKTEYLKQVMSVQQTLQKLEKTYKRLLWLTILAAIGLTSWYFHLGSHQNSVAVKPPQPRAAIASTKSRPNH